MCKRASNACLNFPNLVQNFVMFPHITSKIGGTYLFIDLVQIFIVDCRPKRVNVDVDFVTF